MRRHPLAIIGLGKVGVACGKAIAATEDLAVAGIVRRSTSLAQPLPPPLQRSVQNSSLRHDLIASIHWGGNWGCEITAAERNFAHNFVDVGFDVIHGHSSHHPKAIEVYRDRLILYGCGDFLNDYEGISGYEEFRGELSLMYLPRLCATRRLIDLQLVPFRIARFRLHRASIADTAWLQHRLDSVCRRFQVGLRTSPDGILSVNW